jgi:hypothetical protein
MFDIYLLKEKQKDMGSRYNNRSQESILRSQMVIFEENIHQTIIEDNPSLFLKAKDISGVLAHVHKVDGNPLVGMVAKKDPIYGYTNLLFFTMTGESVHYNSLDNNDIVALATLFNCDYV